METGPGPRRQLGVGFKVAGFCDTRMEGGLGPPMWIRRPLEVQKQDDVGWRAGSSCRSSVQIS